MLLSDAKIRAEKPGKTLKKFRDGRNLYLVVLPTGRKVWRIRYRKPGGADTYFTFGEYCRPPAGETLEAAEARRDSNRLTLSEARLECDRLRGLVRQDTNLSRHSKAERAARNAERINTFEAVSREWISKQEWSPKYLDQVTGGLKRDVFPVLGDIPVREITAHQVLSTLQATEQRGAVTMARLQRQWIGAVFRYAVSTLRADNDPSTALKGALIVPKVKHHRALQHGEISGFLQDLATYGGHRTTVIALQLLLLTFVRPGELRQAEWAEFNLDEAKWRIPAVRMKMKERHIVPLSDQAVELLRELKMLTGNQRWLFPNFRRPRTCMTETTLNRALERMGYNGKGTMGFSAHGFRATASTMLNEMGYRPDVIERQLAHKERNQSRASYNRAEYLGERQNLMQEWANYLDGIAAGADVLPFRGGSSMP
jgi:integrase